MWFAGSVPLSHLAERLTSQTTTAANAHELATETLKRGWTQISQGLGEDQTDTQGLLNHCHILT